MSTTTISEALLAEIGEQMKRAKETIDTLRAENRALTKRLKKFERLHAWENRNVPTRIRKAAARRRKNLAEQAIARRRTWDTGCSGTS